MIRRLLYTPRHAAGRTGSMCPQPGCTRNERHWWEWQTTVMPAYGRSR